MDDDRVALEGLADRRWDERRPVSDAEAGDQTSTSDELAGLFADVERRQATLRALSQALPPSLVSFLR